MNLIFIGTLMIPLFITYLLTFHKTMMYFKVFIFCTLGLGSYFNLKYRMGNLMIADFTLVLFMSSFLITEFRINHSKVNRRLFYKQIYIIYLFLFMLLLGIVSGRKVVFILRDLKLYLYFFLPVFYLLRIREDNNKVKEIFSFLCKMTILCIILNLMVFFTEGMRTIDEGRILRTFGVSLGYGFLVIPSVLCAAYKDSIVKRYNTISYYFIQGTLIGMCVISYTRGVWLQLILTYGIYFIYSLRKKKRVYKAKNILITIFIFTLLVSTLAYMKVSNNFFYNMIAERLSTITSSDTYNYTNSESTLLFRIQDVMSTKDKFKDIRIITGYGFGDTRQAFNENLEEDFSTENSFLYYMWKYGLINFLILMYLILKKFKYMYNTNSKFNQALVISMFIYMLSLSLSGDLNKYYGMPLVSLFFIIDFSTIFNLNIEKLEIQA